VEKLLTLPESPNATLSIRAKALVFHDPGSLHLLDHVERIARSDATVLVTGETGTGKELIARHIHTESRRKGPFIAVNCGAFSESLIDAELFGHEAGAFTGASQARAGWFEAANGGTLFLDEIGDLPMALQVKLLRVLQERQVVRLGSRRSVPLDVRLVAATNIDLARAVEAQHFRADLYYRLSVAAVRLPPLRERPADILPLANHFIAVYRGKLGLADVQLSEGAKASLLAYSWPGNIRELENVIHYALIVCRNGVISNEEIKLLPLVGGSSGAKHAMGIGASIAGSADVSSMTSSDSFVGSDTSFVGLSPWKAAQSGTDLSPMAQLEQAWLGLLAQGQGDLLGTVESVLVRAAYDHASQNQVRTAKVLGITRNMLRTLLKRHGLLGPAGDGVGDSAEPSESLGALG
jgi:sigma-54 dependent transcriptional regulator